MQGSCCSGDWTIKLKDTQPVLADGGAFTQRSTTVFIVGDVEVPPACEEPPCDDTLSLGGFTCLDLWIDPNVVDEESGEVSPALNRGCALHPTLGDSVGVGWCKVQLPATAYSGCDDLSLASGCNDYQWDFCAVEGGLDFQYVSANQGEVISNIDGGEYRYFLFDAMQGAPYHIFTSGYGLSDTVMYIYDTDGVTEIASNDDGCGSMQSCLDWVCQASGTYIIGVRGYSSSDSGGFSVTVEVVVPPNPCDPNPCMNNGVCSDLTFTFSCDCPEEFSGNTCALPNLDGVDYVEVDLCPSNTGHSISDVGILSDGPGDYADNANCGLHIETADGTAVALTFTEFAMESGYDYVYVYDGEDSGAPQLARLDGYNPVTVTTTGGNHMFVRLQSDGSVPDAGFEAIWSAVDPSALPPPPPPNPCSGGITLTGGGDIDFLPAGGYPDNSYCAWTLTCAGTMTLEFSSFATEGGYDYVYVMDGASASDPTVLEEAGSSVPAAITSSGNALRLEFTSDGSVGAAGFSASYTCAELGEPCSGGMSLAGGFAIDFAGDSSAGDDCSWTLSCAAGPVTLTFSSFEASGQTVSVFDGDSTSAPQIGADLSGTDVPSPVVADSETMFLSSTSGAVFMADFACPAPPPNMDPCAGSGVDILGPTSIDFTGGYPDDADCSWTIQCDTGDVTLSFQSFETEGGWDYVYVDGATYDGSSTPGDITGSSSMVIRFTSDGSVGADGFAATATCPDCVGCDTGQTISDDPCQAPVVHHGSSSISFTGGYESSSDCNWVVECESGPATTEFLAFETEGGYDFVYVDGTEYHGSSAPSPITTASGRVEIRFTSDGSVESDGFSAVVECPAVPTDSTGGGVGTVDACNGGATMHGENELSFSLPAAGSEQTCSWDFSCQQAPVQLAFQSYESGNDITVVYEEGSATNLAELTGSLPIGTVPTAPWVQSSSGATLSIEMQLSGDADADFRATVQCPSDVRVPPPPPPPVGDPCAGGATLAGGVISFTGGYPDNADCENQSRLHPCLVYRPRLLTAHAADRPVDDTVQRWPGDRGLPVF